MIIVKKPFRWISAHREATFTFDYEHAYTLFGVSDNGGKASFYFDYDGLNNLEVGDYFFIDSGAYQGYHKVKEIPFPFLYISETDYSVGQTSGTLKFIESHVFKIGVGFDSPATLAAALPYHDIALFKPEPNLDGQLVVNISGYINKIFDVINSNDTVSFGGVTVYPNTFNRVAVFIDNAVVSEHIALNAAITQYELNRDYVGTNRDLNGGSLGNHFVNCGIYEVMQIYGDWVIQSQVYDDGVASAAVADFSLTDFDPSDFSTTT